MTSEKGQKTCFCCGALVTRNCEDERAEAVLVVRSELFNNNRSEHIDVDQILTEMNSQWQAKLNNFVQFLCWATANG